MERKHLLVTGGSRGIGAAICRLAAARGWNVTVNYARDAAAAEMIVAEAQAAGAQAQAVQADMARPEAAEALWDAAEAGLGPVHGFVNNAGVIGRGAPLADRPPEDIRRVIDLNVTGAILAAREAARRMGTDRGGQGGAVVNISSVAARLGGPGSQTDYAASKGAIDTLTWGLAVELGPAGIRVNGIRPGIIATDIHSDLGDPGRIQSLGGQT
ncbi:MAG: SDR family NAD(P)-dependent oxidoreductase, partial [Pseudomonadota bacterium]